MPQAPAMPLLLVCKLLGYLLLHLRLGDVALR